MDTKTHHMKKNRSSAELKYVLKISKRNRKAPLMSVMEWTYSRSKLFAFQRMAAAAPAQRKPDSELTAQEIGERITGLCRDFPQGLSDKVLQNELPGIEPKNRAMAINQLLNTGKIDLLTSPEGVVFYKLKGASKASTVRGDQEEKIVFGIIEEAGNRGTWIRDIRIKSNLGQVSLLWWPKVVSLPAFMDLMLCKTFHFSGPAEQSAQIPGKQETYQSCEVSQCHKEEGLHVSFDYYVAIPYSKFAHE